MTNTDKGQDKGQDKSILSDKEQAALPLEGEIWRSHPYFEGHVEVSNLGRARRIPVKGKDHPNSGIHHPRIINISIYRPSPMPHIKVSIGGRSMGKILPTAVMELFGPKRRRQSDVALPKDGDFTNCAVDNLEWITAAEYRRRNSKRVSEGMKAANQRKRQAEQERIDKMLSDTLGSKAERYLNEDDAHEALSRAMSRNGTDTVNQGAMVGVVHPEPKGTGEGENTTNRVDTRLDEGVIEYKREPAEPAEHTEPIKTAEGDFVPRNSTGRNLDTVQLEIGSARPMITEDQCIRAQNVVLNHVRNGKLTRHNAYTILTSLSITPDDQRLYRMADEASTRHGKKAV